MGTTLEVDVLGVGSSINDVDINALSSLLGVEVLVEGGERETLSVGDTSKTPRGVVLGLAKALLWGIAGGQCMDDGVLLNVLDLKGHVRDGST